MPVLVLVRDHGRWCAAPLEAVRRLAPARPMVRGARGREATCGWQQHLRLKDELDRICVLAGRFLGSSIISSGGSSLQGCSARPPIDSVAGGAQSDGWRARFRSARGRRPRGEV
ncbi:unnamed protein product [Urochloa humidicola]